MVQQLTFGNQVWGCVCTLQTNFCGRPMAEHMLPFGWCGDHCFWCHDDSHESGDTRNLILRPSFFGVMRLHEGVETPRNFPCWDRSCWCHEDSHGFIDANKLLLWDHFPRCHEGSISLEMPRNIFSEKWTPPPPPSGWLPCLQCTSHYGQTN